MKLSTAEQMAINAFLAENWSSFLVMAKDFLSDEEVEDLETRLQQ